jgi:hypothetical protein
MYALDRILYLLLRHKMGSYISDVMLLYADSAKHLGKHSRFLDGCIGKDLFVGSLFAGSSPLMRFDCVHFN